MKKTKKAVIFSSLSILIVFCVGIYMYRLEDKLNEGNISAEVWVNGKNIICSFLFHSESNLPLRYWPLTTPRFVIRSEYEQLFKEFEEFKEKYK